MQCSVGVCILFHVSCKATLHLDPANNLSDASLSQRALKFRPGGTFLGTSLRGEHNLPPPPSIGKGFLSARSKWEQIPTVPICPTGPDDHVCRFKWRCSRYSTEIKDIHTWILQIIELPNGFICLLHVPMQKGWMKSEYWVTPYKILFLHVLTYPIIFVR